MPVLRPPGDRVVDSRVGRDGEFIRRRRECLKCHRRCTTYEYIEDVLPHVVKRDGRREPFDRQKLRALDPQGVREALGGRQARSTTSWPRSSSSCTSAPRRRSSGTSSASMVMEQLQKLDQVAYVRFSSVYRQFQDVSQFSDTVAQLKGLLKDDKPKPVGVPPRPRPLSRRSSRSVQAGRVTR